MDYVIHFWVDLNFQVVCSAAEMKFHLFSANNKKDEWEIWLVTTVLNWLSSTACGVGCVL